MRSPSSRNGRRPLIAALALAAAALLPLSANATGKYSDCRKTAAVEFPGTIVEAAVATPALSTLVQLVVAADLADALSAPGNLTVFAPSNDAFSKIPEPVLGAIGGDLAVLQAVLTYHVVPGKADPRKAVVRKAESLQGQTLFIGYDRKERAPRINQSLADCTAVKTDNGTVWIIDSVLLPQFR